MAFVCAPSHADPSAIVQPVHSFVCTFGARVRAAGARSFNLRLPTTTRGGEQIGSHTHSLWRAVAAPPVPTKETCVLVGVDITTRSALRGETRLFSVTDSLAELERLAETAGMEVMQVITQTLATPVASTYIGTGKVREVKAELNSVGCCTVIFDAELGPSQQRSLEEAFGGEREGIKVLDRTALILDIFAQKASSREALLQTELALYEYRRTRLTRMWLHLSRQAGGGSVACRGPGETQLEVDKRAIDTRISRLRREIDSVRAHRERQRKARRKNVGLPNVALVGYTNAGKSKLLNALTGAEALAEDKLFATLDPKCRKAHLANVKFQPEMLITDTVGFVQNLPTMLVAAFRATLEEVSCADVLAHVVDASAGAELVVARMEAVANVLRDIDAADRPSVIVLNKIDAVSEEELNEVRSAVMEFAPNADIIEISALSGAGVGELGQLLDDVLRDMNVPVEVELPYNEGGALVSAIYEQGSVDYEEHRNHTTFIEAMVPRPLAKRLERYSVVTASSDAPNEFATEHDPTSRMASRDTGDEADDAAYWTRLARKRH